MNLDSSKKTREKEPLADLLRQAVQLIHAHGSGFADLEGQLDGLQERLATGRFHLAVLGQFKRGKSTLLNALLGNNILPSSVVPLTAIPTFVQWGPQLKVRVLFKNKAPEEKTSSEDLAGLREYLTGFVAEERNPGNRLEVEQVELEFPARLLKQGVSLIDTPGIGSTFEHNTEATLNFLPQCDAALFLVSPDPPITAIEVDFLKEVRAKVPRLFFVFNKIDYLSAADLEQSVAFLKKVLSEKAGLKDEPQIFCVSALAGLQAKKAGNAADWQKSGMEQIESHLINFLANNKQRALEEAIARKSRAVLLDALMRLQLGIESLKMPLERLEEKRRLLEEKLESARYQRTMEGDMLEGDKRRAIEQLEERAEALRKEAFGQISEIIHNYILLNNQLDEKLIQQELRKTIPAFFEHAFGEMSRAFEKETNLLLKAHQKRCEELVQRIRKDAAEIFEIPYVPVEQIDILELPKNPHWVTHHWNDSFGLPPEGFFDFLLPHSLRQRRVLKRVDAQIDALVVQNVENVRWSTFQILNDAFRIFAQSIDNKLAEAVAATKNAIDAAHQKRRERSEMVAEELQRMESLKVGLSAISDELQSLCSSMAGKER